MPEKHIAVIPARMGSKSIKDKNLLEINGKSLVRVAVEKAMEARIFTRILVTSDYPRYKLGIEDVYGDSYTKIEFFRRPEDLATDDAKMIDVLKQVLGNAKGPEEWVWLLQPTSPFRDIHDFKMIHEAISTGKWESVISFKPVEDNTNRIYSVKNAQAYRYKNSNYDNKQKLRTEVTRSGNFYVTRRKYILEHSSIENKPFYTYMMGNIDVEKATDMDKKYSRMLGINIDSEDHWTIAKNHLRRGDIRG